MDPDPDADGSCHFRHWPSQDANKNLIERKKIFAYYFLKVHVHHFQRWKVKKKSPSSRNQGFSYFFCLVIERSGSGAGARSILLIDGSGSGSRRPKKVDPDSDPDPQHWSLLNLSESYISWWTLEGTGCRLLCECDIGGIKFTLCTPQSVNSKRNQPPREEPVGHILYTSHSTLSACFYSTLQNVS